MSAIFPNMDQVLSGYPDIATVDVPSSQMAFMTCSNADLGCTGPITDPAVRKAIYYALDRDQINKLALNDQYSELAGSLYPYGQFTKYMSEDVPDSPIPVRPASTRRRRSSRTPATPRATTASTRRTA